MSKTILAVKVSTVDNQSSIQLRNGNSGAFTVELKTEFLPGKAYWTAIPKTFLTLSAAEKHAVKLANKFSCGVEK